MLELSNNRYSLSRVENFSYQVEFIRYKDYIMSITAIVNMVTITPTASPREEWVSVMKLAPDVLDDEEEVLYEEAEVTDTEAGLVLKTGEDVNVDVDVDCDEEEEGEDEDEDRLEDVTALEFGLKLELGLKIDLRVDVAAKEVFSTFPSHSS